MIKIGLICMAIGAVLIAGVGVIHGFDFHVLAETVEQKKAFEINEPFAEIEVGSDSGTIRVEKSQDDVCRVECWQSENYMYNVSVQAGRLKIEGERKGLLGLFHLGANDPVICLYLSEGAYDRIDAEAASGDVVIAEGLTFGNVAMNTASGNITFSGAASDTVEAKSASGKIQIFGSANCAELHSTSGSVSVTGDVKTIHAQMTSGGVRIADGAVETVNVSATSGSIAFENVNAESLSASTSSGRVQFINADAQKIDIETVSGSVTGTLRSDKIFNVKTTSGDVQTPRSAAGGGECDIQTTSGDVSITVE